MELSGRSSGVNRAPSGGVSAATTRRSNVYKSESGQTSIEAARQEGIATRFRESLKRLRMSYDAEKATLAAAFSEESVRRGFIKKVLIFYKNFPHSFRSTPYSLFNSWSPLALLHFSTSAPEFKNYSWTIMASAKSPPLPILHSGRSSQFLRLQASSSSWS